MRDFVREWQSGFRVLLSVFVLGGLILMSAALAGMLAFGFIIALPAELIFQAVIPERAYVWIASLSAAVWGVAGLGRCKNHLIGAMSERP